MPLQCFKYVYALYKLCALWYLGSLLTNKNYIQEEIKCRLKAGNSCYYSVQTLCLLDFSLRI